MASDRHESTLIEEFAQELSAANPDGMRHMLELLLNVVMRTERSQVLQAEPYERSEDRRGYANGFKDKTLQTRMGPLQLKVPKVRGLEFYPQSLERGSRSERALKLAVAEMYLKGVSTRKVESVLEELCGMEISSTQVSRATQLLDGELETFRNAPLPEIVYLFLDATYIKVRVGGVVQSMACLIAFGVDAEGRRNVLGASMSLSEAEVHWREFLSSLQRRGMHGVKLITSDDHAGLRAAREALFSSTPWQRCQFHLAQNAQAYSPRKSMRQDIAQAIRDIFASSDLDSAREMVRRVSARYEKSAPDFVAWLDDNIEEGLTVYRFPSIHRKRLRTVNGVERANREIKRRTRVAVLFPNKESALRLVLGVLIEIHEEWVTGTKYLDMETAWPIQDRSQAAA
jgi:putative transposase